MKTDCHWFEQYRGHGECWEDCRIKDLKDTFLTDEHCENCTSYLPKSEVDKKIRKTSMIIEVKNGDHGIEDKATLKELASFLNELLEAYPEYSNRTVMVSAECGHSGACIATPLTAATIPNQDYSYLRLISNDDGQYSDSYKFYRRVAKNENN